jgi:hypothetical protein
MDNEESGESRPIRKKKRRSRVSLHPLSFEDAVKGLLDTKPPKKRGKKK